MHDQGCALTLFYPALVHPYLNDIWVSNRVFLGYLSSEGPIGLVSVKSFIKHSDQHRLGLMDIWSVGLLVSRHFTSHDCSYEYLHWLLSAHDVHDLLPPR